MTWIRGCAVVLLALAACDQREPKTAFDPYSRGLTAPLDAIDAPDAALLPDATLLPDASGVLEACAVVAFAGRSEPPVVVLNEVFAGSLLDEQDDWFEIYNAGSQPVVLDGWTVEDFFTGDVPKDTPASFEFPSGTVVCPGAFLDVRRGAACEASATTFDFGIGSTDRLLLTDPSGAVVDEVGWHDLPQGQSVGRVDDGPGTLRRLASPTPGFSNSKECECCGECLIGACELRDGACVVESEQSCQMSVACAQLGWCGLQDGKCVAVDSEGCQLSDVCMRRGRCGVVAGACEVVADADCRASKACENEGRCSADTVASACIATSQADCEASHDCVHLEDDGSIASRKNRCTLRDQSCVATACEDTTVCELKMCCSLVDGKCVRP